MNKKIMCLSVLALSVSMSQGVLACSDHAHRYYGERLEKAVEKLDLSAEQKEKIKVVREKSKADIRSKFEELHTLQHQKNEILAEPNLNEKKLDGVIHQEKEVLGSMLKIRAMERHEISGVLTVKQKAEFSEMMQKWEKEHHDNRKD